MSTIAIFPSAFPPLFRHSEPPFSPPRAPLLPRRTHPSSPLSPLEPGSRSVPKRKLDQTLGFRIKQSTIDDRSFPLLFLLSGCPSISSPPRSLVRDGHSPHRPRLVVSRSTCPPLSPPPPLKQLCTRSCSNKHTPPNDHSSLFAWGEGDSGGHVLRETTSRGLCGLVCPSCTSERGREGDCAKEGGGGEGERERERALGLLLYHRP